MSDFTTKIADLITGGKVSEQEKQITQMKNRIRELEGQISGWEHLMKSVLPIVQARAGDILQETWKELMSDEQSFTTSEIPK